MGSEEEGAETNVLQEAQDTVATRAEEYGPPHENFEVIAGLWSEYLGMDITKYDYCQMMTLAKIGRARTGEPSRDGHRDQCGYSYLADLMADTEE